MPTTYTKPDQNLSFAIPDEGEVFGVAGNDQNFYRRRGNTIETVNYVNALLGADAGQFGNAGEQRQEAIRRAQAQGLNLEANTYNWGDITSSGLFQLGGNSGPTSVYSGDLTSFLNQRAGLPTSQQTLTRGTPTINPYGVGALTDQFGNVVQQQTQNTVAQNQANALAQNAGLPAPTPEMQRIAEANAQLMGPTGQVPQGYSSSVQGQLIPSVSTLPRQALIQGQLPPAAREATNLNDFYTASGMALPSIAERGSLFERAGLGSAAEYRGTTAQNNALLKTLQSQASMGRVGDGPELTGSISPDVMGKEQGFDIGSLLGKTISYEDVTTGNIALFNQIKEQNDKAIADLEKQQSDIDKKILSALEGNPAQELQSAEQQQGVAEKRKALEGIMLEMSDLEARHNATQEKLRNQAIPNAFVIGQQNEENRAYALESTALGTKALLLQGNLEYAEKKAREYVDLKYRDKEMELQQLQIQAEAISRQLGRADTKAQNDLALYLDLRREALDAQKAEDNSIFDIAGSVSDIAPASVVTKILDSKDRNAALALATPYLQQKATAAKSSGGISNQTIDNERSLLSQFNSSPIVKDYNTILAKKLSVDQILNSKLGGPGDLATVYEFMKALDPTSVVRETEYASAAKSGNIFAGALAQFNGYLKPNGGFLPPQVKAGFQSIINSKLDVQTQLYNNTKAQYEDVARRQGLNPNNVTIDYSGVVQPPMQGPTMPQDYSSLDDNAINAQVEQQQGGGSGLWSWLTSKLF